MLVCFGYCYYPAPAASLTMNALVSSQLFEDLVQSMDNHNAASFTKAENPKNGATSTNGWYLTFYDLFHPITGKARQFKTTESSDRISNFKGKVVNQIWPEFEKNHQE